MEYTARHDWPSVLPPNRHTVQMNVHKGFGCVSGMGSCHNTLLTSCPHFWRPSIFWRFIICEQKRFFRCSFFHFHRKTHYNELFGWTSGGSPTNGIFSQVFGKMMTRFSPFLVISLIFVPGVTCFMSALGLLILWLNNFEETNWSYNVPLVFVKPLALGLIFPKHAHDHVDSTCFVRFAYLGVNYQHWWGIALPSLVSFHKWSHNFGASIGTFHFVIVGSMCSYGFAPATRTLIGGPLCVQSRRSLVIWPQPQTKK